MVKPPFQCGPERELTVNRRAARAMSPS
jgi:hypothetical protein